MTGRGEGVRPIMIYDNDREGGLKHLDILSKFKQEIHKRGRFCLEIQNSTILL